MFKDSLSNWNKKRLQLVLVVFFFSLAIPTAILIKQAYSQLKWEAFHHYRTQAEELVNRIDTRYKDLIKTESARAFTDYAFLNVAGNIKNRALQRSPLSTFPVNKNFPGIIGYFQVDNNGKFTSPLLPASTHQDYGINQKEHTHRLKLQNKIYQILNQNKLVSEKTERTSTQEEIVAQDIELEISQHAPQAAFDQLSSQGYNQKSKPSIASSVQGRVEDLKLKKQYLDKAKEKTIKRESLNKKLTRQKTQKLRSRKESNVLPNYPTLVREKKSAKKGQTLQVNMFESEIGELEFNLLESGHFVLYRTVWKNDSRYIQGLLIKPEIFIRTIASDSFYKTNVSSASNLTIAYQGNILSTLKRQATNRLESSSNQGLQGTLLLQNNLSSTLEKIELIFSVDNLPAGPGGSIITWLSTILLLILCSGFFILYILGKKQITLARQQQDFVSAVSHELKTPLTSIRMYGEMLREGWTTEEKRKQYYDYIYDESERLTRLINNVLQLARMNRNELPVDLKPYTLAELIDNIQSKITSQVERAGFQLNLYCDNDIKENKILADTDYFIQVIINLVDNAIKFSSKSETKKVDISCRMQTNNKIQINIRDYGPGITKNQSKKIFDLFYRSENELTRETVGTGIGLSLVKQLVISMQASIEIENKNPGAEFKISFKSA